MSEVLPAVRCSATSPTQSVDQALHRGRRANQTLAHRGLEGLELGVQSLVTWCSEPLPHQMNRDSAVYQSPPDTKIEHIMPVYQVLHLN